MDQRRSPPAPAWSRRTPPGLPAWPGSGPRLTPPDFAWNLTAPPGPTGHRRACRRGQDPDSAGRRTSDLAGTRRTPPDPAGTRRTWPDVGPRRTAPDRLAGRHISVIGLSARRVMKGSCSGARCDKPLTRTRVGVGGSQLKSGRGGLAGVARVGRGGRRWPSRRADDKNMRPDIGPDIGPDIRPDIGPDVGPDVGPDIGPEGVRSQRLTSTFRAGNALAKVA